MQKPDASFQPCVRKIIRMSAGAALLCWFATGVEALAQSGAFPAGKTVSAYVGTTPGGSHDLAMRLVARHIGQHLPGNPNVIPRNMPGAGARKLAAHLTHQAPKDGTEFGVLIRGIVTETLMSSEPANFDMTKLTWIGTPASVTEICGVWHTVGVNSMEDLAKREIVMAGSATDSSETIQANVLNNLVAAKVRTVVGYTSGREMNLAMERGEAHARCGTSWEGLKASYPNYIKDNLFRVFVQFSMTRHAELPNVPAIGEYAKTDMDKQALEVVTLPVFFGYPFAAPPGLSAETTTLLRGAFMSTMDNSGFREDAKKQGLDISPVAGDVLAKRLVQIYAYERPVIDRVLQLSGQK